MLYKAERQKIDAVLASLGRIDPASDRDLVDIIAHLEAIRALWGATGPVPVKGPVKRSRAAIDLDLDTTGMTDTEVHAYYKRTAALRQVRLSLSLGHTPDIEARYMVLQGALEANGGKHTPETKAELTAIQCQWRRSLLERDKDRVTHPDYCQCQACVYARYDAKQAAEATELERAS